MLGIGSYGSVTKKDIAVKKLNRLSDLLQEYTAMQACRDCPYIVDPLYIDIINLELAMKKYDGDLRKLLPKLNIEQKHKVVKDVLLALIFLHDRKLLHGDIKPNNILLNMNPFRSVLGDCGFLSVTEKSKVKYGNWFYRGPNPLNSSKQDIYSLGIVLLEIYGGYRISQSGAIKDDIKSYPNLKEVSKKVIKDPKLSKIISQMVSQDKKERPSARFVFMNLFGKNNLPIAPVINRMYLTNSLEEKSSDNIIRNYVKKGAHSYELARARTAYRAFIDYCLRKSIPNNKIPIYCCAALIISVAALSKYTFKNINEFISNNLGIKIDKIDVLDAMKNLLDDSHFSSDILFNDLI